MTNPELTAPSRPRGLLGTSRPRLASIGALLGYTALAAIVAWWTWRAFNDPAPRDMGLAYKAGVVSWSSGHPEHLFSWDGTPFLAAVMALVSRVISAGAAIDLLNVLNLALVVGVVGLTLYRLKRHLSPAWWWIAALALFSFSPMMSSVWWKQFNVIALVLALASFELLRRGQAGRAGAALGLSVAVKPLAFLLPFVLLARRDTRRAGVISIVWTLCLNLAGQALLAARAGSISALNPYIPLHNFTHKVQPTNIWACHTENFAPGSLLCRLAGPNHWVTQHIVVWVGVALVGLWIIDSLRGRAATSWEVFAFACPLSVMLSPIAWSHYQIMLAPLFVLLLVRMAREGARIGEWAGLAVAFLLASLVWQPFGSSVSNITGLYNSQQELFAIDSIAQFAQYALVLTGVLWYTRTARSAQSAVRSSTSA